MVIISQHQDYIMVSKERAGYQFSMHCKMERSSEMDDRIPGVDRLRWSEGKRVQMTQEDLQEGRFQSVMKKQVRLTSIKKFNFLI